MFRISFLVEDKRLPEVLHGLAGKVVEMEPPVPVQGYGGGDRGPSPLPAVPLPKRNFVPGPKAHATNPERNPLEDIRKHIKKGDTLNSADISDTIAKIGWSRGSFSYAIKKAMMAKILRRVGVGQYEVI